jgi:glyoxylase-like metal-dependent hydrolase (beta-lactamase superfamily II)/rhodanese-related sulfurtransferase
MLVFRQLFDPTSSTYTYLLADRRSGDAVLIDPVFEQARRDATLVEELGLSLRWTIETHTHADHVTGAWLLANRLGSRIAVPAAGGAEGADRLLSHDDRIGFGARHLRVRATPGHTDGCLSCVLDDETMAFTGDALLIRGCGRTDFQQGDARRLYRSVRTQLFSLPPDCLLYPGHDYRGMTVTSVREETAHNPRLGGEVGEDDFVGFMAHLNLPHPKQIDVAVPANLRCGRVDDARDATRPPGWAPLDWSFAGMWTIRPAALEEALGAVQVVDVREPDEFDGPLGRIASARSIPLGTLEARVGELDRATPVVAVCRSGARSAQAVTLLQKAGWTDVANLAGGMLRWRADGHPVAGGQA